MAKTGQPYNRSMTARQRFEAANQAAMSSLGGLLGPIPRSNLQRANSEFEQDFWQQQALQQEALDAQAAQDALGYRDQLTAAGVDARAIPGLQPALERGGQGVVAGLLANPATPMSEGYNRAQLMAEMDAAEAASGRFGSGLTYKEYQPLEQRAIGVQQGRDQLQFIADVTRNTTPAQLASPVMAETRGRLKTIGISWLSRAQSLIENKDSVLRPGELDLLQEITGDPASFISGLTSMDEATIGKLQEIQTIYESKYQGSLSSLDSTTRGLLDQAMTFSRDPSYYKFQTPEGAVIRDPVMERGTAGEPEDLGWNPSGIF